MKKVSKQSNERKMDRKQKMEEIKEAAAENESTLKKQKELKSNLHELLELHGKQIEEQEPKIYNPKIILP